MKPAQWLVLREVVLRRDKYQCQTCFKRAEDVHHVIPRRKQGLNVIENLTSLCVACHKLIELYRLKFQREVPPKFETHNIASMKFRGKLITMGDKYLIVIPKAYHNDAKPFKGHIVDIEVTKV